MDVKRITAILCMIAVIIILPAGCAKNNLPDGNNTSDHTATEEPEQMIEEEFMPEESEKQEIEEDMQDKAEVPKVLKAEVIDSAAIQEKVLKRLKQDTVKTVYSKRYQEAANKVSQSLYKKAEYTLEHPLFIMNPYGTVENGLYLRYTSNQPCTVEYTVYTDHESIDEFEEKLSYKEETYGNNQEGMIIGLIPGCRNYLLLTEYDETGNVIAEQVFLVNLENMKTSYPVMIPEEKLSMEGLSEGFYWMLTGASRKNKSIFAVDNQGISRIGLAADGSVNYSVIKAGHLIGYPKDKKTIAMINEIGQAEHIYNLGDYRYESGLRYQEETNSLFFMAVDSKKKNSQKIILKIDVETGEQSVIVDFNEFSQEGMAEINPDSFGIYDDKILVNSSESSSIYCIKRGEDGAETAYVITNPGASEENSLSGLCYEPIGSFDPMVHQTGIQVNTNDEQLLKGQYYITMISGEEDARCYYEIFVDENTQTYTLANRIAFDSEVTGISVQSYGSHEVILFKQNQKAPLETDEETQIDSVIQVIGEYDSTGKKIGSITLPHNVQTLLGVKKMIRF